ncbi:MAG: glutamine synthetase [Prolixibacteraceae bacterium]|nr:glutamine synthetase [Prolixibacteraceae bacterium]
MIDREEILKKIKLTGHNKIKFAISDIDGVLRSKIININNLKSLENGDTGLCDVLFGWDIKDKCYDNSTFTGWHTGYPDQKVKLDLSTFRTIPWENDLPFFMGDFEVKENGEDIYPRTLLKKINDNCLSSGFQAMFSEEFEWTNFLGHPNQLEETNYQKLTPLTPGMFGYSSLRPELCKDYFYELYDFLEKFDIPLEAMHTETGPGVYEAALVYDKITQAADKAVMFKEAVKEIAYRHNIIASFMAKWKDDLPGCSGHIHQSLWNREETVNYFSPEMIKKSSVFENYLAGQLFCLPEILPMYAPTVNSYKRLTPGSWAPNTVSWGKENRTTAIRYIEGKNSGSHLELRVPGSDSNPYLSMAASLASGLYGIQHKLSLKIPETKGNAYDSKNITLLPSDLTTATKKMKNSSIAKELFGETFVNHFIRTREWEWREYSKAVTDWEIKRYLEII